MQKIEPKQYGQGGINIKDIECLLHKIAIQYPACLQEEQLRDIPRIAFHIFLALSNRPPASLSVCDIGGGVGLFSVGCAALGCKEVILVDDFEDQVNKDVGDSIFSIHKMYGVRVIQKDVIKEELSEIPELSLDTVSSFNSMEHWHHSPKALFHKCVKLLKSKGMFILGVPNCIDLKNRIIVPFGFYAWFPITDWYDATKFRGHVREPSTADLKYISSDLKLKDVKIIGRYWGGLKSPNLAIRMLSRTLDFNMRFFPSLCSDIYLIAHR